RARSPGSPRRPGTGALTYGNNAQAQPGHPVESIFWLRAAGGNNPPGVRVSSLMEVHPSGNHLPPKGSACRLCGGASTAAELAEAGWLSSGAREGLVRRHPRWRRGDGACPACVQHALLETLLEKGEEALHDGVQQVWPLDPEAAFGALPTPLRLH